MANLFDITIPINTTTSALTYSGAYRIFNVSEPITAQYLHNINNIFNYGNNNPAYLSQYFRYSIDNSNWSQWYDFASLSNRIMFNQNAPIYMAFKVAYDNGTTDVLQSPITLREINAQFVTERPKASLQTGSYTVSEEMSILQYVTKNVNLSMYDMNNMNSIVALNEAYSYAMMNFVGVDSVYISTSPDNKGTDYFFREYTILNYKDMKCCKIVAEKNQFPDNNFTVSGSGLNSVSFSVDIDKNYFQDVFGNEAQPRQGDVIYIPLINKIFVVSNTPRMIQGAMAQPMFWKLILSKYENNRMYNQSSNPPASKFIDDLTLTTDEAYGNEYDAQVKDALLTQQFQPKTTTYADMVRDTINAEIHQTQVDFNYNRLIDFHYYNNTTSDIAVNYVKEFEFNSSNNDISLSGFVRLKSGFTSTKLFFSTDNQITLNMQYNSNTSILQLSVFDKVLTCDAINVDEWYAFFIVLSPTYKQIRFVVYSMPSDARRGNGYFKFNIKGKASFDNITTMPNLSNVKLNIGSGDYDIANIRVFNKGIEEESQQLSLSQLISKDEKLLHIADNSRPTFDRPFIGSRY